LYKNFDKIFDTPSKDFEKPYHHFVIVCHGKLTRNDRNLLIEKARTRNVHVFEDVIKDVEANKRLSEELDKFRIPIAGLIEKRGTTNKLETICEAINGLDKITPCLVVKNQPYSIHQVTISSNPQQKSNKSIALPNNPLFDSKKYREFVLVPIPREKFVLIIPGTSFSIDLYIRP
jgi:hypothetical protein